MATKINGRQIDIGKAPITGSNGTLLSDGGNGVGGAVGLTLTGSVFLLANPTEDLQAATKAYVDSQTGGSIPTRSIAFGQPDGSGFAGDKNLVYLTGSDDSGDDFGGALIYGRFDANPAKVTSGNLPSFVPDGSGSVIFNTRNIYLTSSILVGIKSVTTEIESSTALELKNTAGTGAAAAGETDAAIQLHAAAGGIGLLSELNNDNAISIEANGGVNETVAIRSNQGTGVATADIANVKNASISLVSDDGGIGLGSAAGLDGAIFLETDGGANETIVIHSNQGTGVATPDIANAKNASIALYSDVGGVAAVSGLNNEGAIFIGADAGTDETVRVHSHQGTGVNAKGGSTDASINLVSDAGGIGLYSAANLDNAITLETNGGDDDTIQVRANQGTGVATADIANAVNASIALISDEGGVALASAAGLDGAIFLETDGGANETIVIHSNQGTGVATPDIANAKNASIALYSDVGGVAAVSGLNDEGAIFIGADAGINETVRVHSNQGTGVNAKAGSTDASINLVSDVGGIGLYSAANLANAITIEANGGDDETIRITANQGTGEDSISIGSDEGGIAISGSLGVMIGTGTGNGDLSFAAGGSGQVVVQSKTNVTNADGDKSGGAPAGALQLHAPAGGVYVGAGNNMKIVAGLGNTDGGETFEVQDVAGQAQFTVSSAGATTFGDGAFNYASVGVINERPNYFTSSVLFANLDNTLDGGPTAPNSVVGAFSSSLGASGEHITASPAVYLNGLRIRSGSIAQVTAGSRDYYTLKLTRGSVNYLVVSMSTPPLPGDVIQCDFRRSV